MDPTSGKNKKKTERGKRKLGYYQGIQYQQTQRCENGLFISLLSCRAAALQCCKAPEPEEADA